MAWRPFSASELAVGCAMSMTGTAAPKGVIYLYQIKIREIDNYNEITCRTDFIGFFVENKS